MLQATMKIVEALKLMFYNLFNGRLYKLLTKGATVSFLGESVEWSCNGLFRQSFSNAPNP